MKRSNVLFYLVGAVGLAGLLSACGSEEAPPVSASASGSGSASASGTVTGFGSLFVNGKQFETENVEVRHDGVTEFCNISSNPAERCGLKRGMTVKVSGSFSGSSHRASSITQEDTLEGPITSVDVPNSRFAVLGQTVLVDDTTQFDSGVSLANLAPNQVVEVSGFIKNAATGEIVASFIERKAGTGCGTDGCEIKGVVKNHNHATTRFEIGGLTVAYNNTTIINDMPVPTGSNWNDIFVEVKGTSFDAATTTLTATKVEPENEGNGDDVDEFEVEGFVTEVVSVDVNTRAADFFIGTTQVKTNSNTEFRGGTVDEIVVGAKMSAEGRFDGRTLIAKHVKFHASVKLEGNVVDIVPGSSGVNEFKLAGLGGLTVTVKSQTEFKDTTRGTLSNANHVRVRGRVSGSSSVIATSIELRSPDNDVDLQGPVQDDPVVVPNLTILGVTVETNGVQFEGINDEPISQAAFFAAVKNGTLVKVKGVLNGTTVTWDEAELED